MVGRLEEDVAGHKQSKEEEEKKITVNSIN